VYFGIKTFFSRLSLIIQALIYWIVRSITGFTPETMQSAQITEAMKFGIRFELAGATGLLLLIAAIIFLLKYDLGLEKLANIRNKIDTMHSTTFAEEGEK
jgi:Na+/melibiose symporter-like transporter